MSLESVEQNQRMIEQSMAKVKQLAASHGIKLEGAIDLQSRKNALVKENKELSLKIDALVKELTELERLNGVNVEPFVRTPVAADKGHQPVQSPNPDPPAQTKPEITAQDKANQGGGQKKENEKPKKGSGDKPAANTAGDEKVDVSRLDFRIGKIVEASKHPDADALYVEQIDIGEGRNRNVVSGLVKFVPIEQMQNRMVVLLCNLKPAKMRGVTSEAMVMCASTPDKVEILSPPEGCVPGERVVFEKHPGKPDAQLNPKKKIWESVAPDLKTDENCVAHYKGDAFTVPGKGVCRSATLANVQVK